MSTRKLCYRKDDRAMRPTHECPETLKPSAVDGSVVTLTVTLKERE